MDRRNCPIRDGIRKSVKLSALVGIGSSSVPFEQSNKHSKDGQSMSACILEFDGASKGNPGKAGAGAILRAEDGSVISRIHQGLGNVTNNVAEYRALILGMKYALKRGFKQIRVQGDSNLVVQQVNGVWQCKHQNMTNLCKEAKELKDKFLSFKISHVLRALCFRCCGSARAAARRTGFGFLGAADIWSGRVYVQHPDSEER